MKKISRLIDLINDKIGHFLAWLTIIMIFIGTYNAITRKLSQYIGINLSSNRYIELQWYFYGIIFIFGSAYALLHKEHVRIDIFYNRFSRKTRNLINFLAGLFIYIPCTLVLTILAIPMAKKSWEIKEMSPDPAGLPRYPLKILLVVGLFTIFLQAVSETIKSFYALREKSFKEKG